MGWLKQGRIFHVTGQFVWMASHSSLPIPDPLTDRRMRVYFGARDAEGRSRPGFIEVDPEDPASLLHLHEQPVLDLGGLGAFDEEGVTPCCIVGSGEEKYLYYLGWNRAVAVPYRTALGVAVSTDGGVSFARVYEGPVLDRSATEPHFIAASFVMREGGTWRMWYTGTTSWLEVNGRPEPLYHIKYAESDDGLDWRREDLSCLTPRTETEAVGRPWVVRDGDRYRMWFSYRGSVEFRTDPAQSYRIGYAESPDGLVWERMDEAGIDVSEDGWDSQMIEYPSVYRHGGTIHLLYNGNGFGESGIGHAVMD